MVEEVWSGTLTLVAGRRAACALQLPVRRATEEEVALEVRSKETRSER